MSAAQRTCLYGVALSSTFASSAITNVAATVDVQSHLFLLHWVVSATVDVQRRRMVWSEELDHGTFIVTPFCGLVISESYEGAVK